jgi:hypothetical protein
VAVDSTPANVRSLAPLWHLRQRRHVVVACLDDAHALEGARAAIRERGGELVVEHEPGPLSAALGRPSVTVADRFGTVGWHGADASAERVLDELLAFQLSCPECGPQAWGDPGA